MPTPTSQDQPVVTVPEPATTNCVVSVKNQSAMQTKHWSKDVQIYNLLCWHIIKNK